MKILHILDHSLPLHSGYTFRSQNLFKAQQDMGFEPLVLTSPKHEESAGETGQTGGEMIEGIRYYRTGLSTSSRLPMVSEIRLMYKLLQRMKDVIKKERPDIIHAHSPILNGLPSIWAARCMGLPLVYEIRAFWEDAAVDHGSYGENSWKYRLTKWLETQVCRYADHVCIICRGLKNDLVSRNIPEEKIAVVFNGIHPESFKRDLPDTRYLEQWGLEGKKIIGFVGSFYRYEGLDLLVKAFSELAHGPDQWRLLLVGGGEMTEELQGLIRSLGIQGKVVMPGRVPHERIAGVYAMIDILAYPRYSMRLTELVTPLKPLEAMAMGKALLASDVGGHQELIGHGKTGILFKAGNLEDFKEKLSELMGDEKLRHHCGTTGYKWVRAHHSWAATTSVYQDVYRQLKQEQLAQ